MPPAASTAVPAARKGIYSARGIKPSAPRKSGAGGASGSGSGGGPSGSGSRIGPAAKGGDEGYLYLAGVKDGSKRVGEFSVSCGDVQNTSKIWADWISQNKMSVLSAIPTGNSTLPSDYLSHHAITGCASLV